MGASLSSVELSKKYNKSFLWHTRYQSWFMFCCMLCFILSFIFAMIVVNTDRSIYAFSAGIFFYWLYRRSTRLIGIKRHTSDLLAMGLGETEALFIVKEEYEFKQLGEKYKQVLKEYAETNRIAIESFKKEIEKELLEKYSFTPEAIIALGPKLIDPIAYRDAENASDVAEKIYDTILDEGEGLNPRFFSNKTEADLKAKKRYTIISTVCACIYCIALLYAIRGDSTFIPSDTWLYVGKILTLIPVALMIKLNLWLRKVGYLRGVRKETRSDILIIWGVLVVPLYLFFYPVVIYTSGEIITRAFGHRVDRQFVVEKGKYVDKRGALRPCVYSLGFSNGIFFPKACLGFTHYSRLPDGLSTLTFRLKETPFGFATEGYYPYR